MSIDITQLTESDKGREVRYETHGSVEFGRITSWNGLFIFVRYHTKLMRSLSGNTWTIPRIGETSEATSPSDLDFASMNIPA